MSISMSFPALDADDLAPARGVFWAVMLGVAFWVFVGLVVWWVVA